MEHRLHFFVDVFEHGCVKPELFSGNEKYIGIINIRNTSYLTNERNFNYLYIRSMYNVYIFDFVLF